jgi:hypothetical protein
MRKKKPKEIKGFCEWTKASVISNTWDTGCGNWFIIVGTTPEEKGYNFCPMCGKRLRSI